MRLGRTVLLADIGMDRGTAGQGDGGSPLAQVVDHAAALWRSDAKQTAAVRAAEPVRGPAAIVPVFEWENPPDDLDVPRRGRCRVDGAQVRFLRARTRYERMYREAGGIPVRPRVVAFLNGQVAPLFKSGYDDATGRQLHRAVGGLTALAGIRRTHGWATGLAAMPACAGQRRWPLASAAARNHPRPDTSSRAWSRRSTPTRWLAWAT